MLWHKKKKRRFAPITSEVYCVHRSCAKQERQREKGDISAAQLREVEDRCIRDAVKMQEDVGMQGITDGEFRRTLWHADFLEPDRRRESRRRLAA